MWIYHIMPSNPTYLPVPSHPPSVLATPQNQKQVQRKPPNQTNQTNKTTKRLEEGEESHLGSSSAAC